MNIENIILDENLNVKWNEIETNDILSPYINLLKNRGYHSVWHLEGNAWTHTKNVVEEMDKLYPFTNFDKNDNEKIKIRKITILSALFHDFGKAMCGFQKEDGNWSFPSHEYESEKIVRKLLWDNVLREEICYMVKNHMIPLEILNTNNKNFNIIKLSYGKCNINMLVDLKLADCRGSIMAVDDKFNEKLQTVKTNAIYLHCLYSPYHFDNEYEKFTYFQTKKQYKDDKTQFKVYIMCGLSGSGKSTYINNNLSNIKVVSRDIIRKNLNICKDGEKVVGTKEEESEVTQIENNLIIELCKSKTDFVIDDMFLQKKYRNKILNLIMEYRPYITIIYVEAPTLEDNINRRKGQIDSNILNSMINKLDFPSEIECMKLIINKQ